MHIFLKNIILTELDNAILWYYFFRRIKAIITWIGMEKENKDTTWVFYLL